MTATVQEYFKNFEKLKIDPFESKEVLLDDSNKLTKTYLITFELLTHFIISHQRFYPYLISFT